MSARPAGRVERKREQRRRHMCRVAGRIVRAEGLDALTIARLARELDCAVGSIYTYFPSKDALVAELTAHAAEVLADAYERAEPAWHARLRRRRSLDAAGTALASLLAFYEFFAAAALELPEEFGLMRLALTDPHPIVPDSEVPIAFEAMSRLVGLALGLLEEAESSRAITADDRTERLFMWAPAAVTLVGLGKLARYGVSRTDPAALGRRLTLDLLAGWGAPPDALEDAAAAVAALRGDRLFSPPVSSDPAGGTAP